MSARLSAAILGLLLAAPGARAQTSACTMTALPNPPREVLVCADGLTLTAERASDYRLLDRNRDGRPEAAELTDKGLLVEAPPGRRIRFQILTPHAIASVRGTVWAVDVQESRTSVFVQRGVVSVRRPGVRAVTLRAGDGVDVDAGTTTLEVKRWGAPRAAALLARFGR